MRDHKPTCSRHGGGHRTTRDEARASWSYGRTTVPVRSALVDDDGVVLIDLDGGEEVVGWHHDVAVLRRALATGKPVTYQPEVGLLHVGAPFQALGPWAFSLGDALAHDGCGPGRRADRRRARRAPASERTSFAVPYGPGGGHTVLVKAVARLLERLEREPVRQAVILAIGGRALFTQALVHRDTGVWLEAVSNTFIDEPADRLTDDQHLLLAAFGYRPPTATVPNHHQRVEPPARLTTVAELLVAPLEAVYGLRPDEEVRVDVFPAVGG